LDGSAKYYGILEEAPEIENFQAQTPQTDAGKPPQEAFALQGVAGSVRRADRFRDESLRFRGKIDNFVAV
jgi:hypothetical protein